MRTARSLPYGGSPWQRTHPRNRDPETETPMDRDHPGQRPPWTETNPWTETPDRDPHTSMDRDPLYRDPLYRDPLTETPRQIPHGQRPPGQRPPLTETPLDRDLIGQRPPWTETTLDRDPLDRDPWTETPLWRESQTGECQLIWRNIYLTSFNPIWRLTYILIFYLICQCICDHENRQVMIAETNFVMWPKLLTFRMSLQQLREIQLVQQLHEGVEPEPGAQLGDRHLGLRLRIGLGLEQ